MRRYHHYSNVKCVVCPKTDICAFCRHECCTITTLASIESYQRQQHLFFSSQKCIFFYYFNLVKSGIGTYVGLSHTRLPCMYCVHCRVQRTKPIKIKMMQSVCDYMHKPHVDNNNKHKHGESNLRACSKNQSYAKKKK